MRSTEGIYGVCPQCGQHHPVNKAATFGGNGSLGHIGYTRCGCGYPSTVDRLPQAMRLPLTHSSSCACLNGHTATVERASDDVWDHSHPSREYSQARKNWWGGFLAWVVAKGILQTCLDWKALKKRVQKLLMREYIALGNPMPQIIAEG